MDFHTHVFISYAHADNLEAGGPGWVSRFHELLEPFLTSRLKRTKAVIWRDKRLSDNDVFDPVIMQQLPDSAVLVAVLTDNYVDSKWCLREAEAFCEAAKAKVGLTPNNKSRVFKVIKLPPEGQSTLPAPMRETLGTPFFVRVDKDRRESQDRNDRAVELDPNYGAGYGEKLKLQVALLAQDIADTLKAIDAAGAAAAAQASSAAGAAGTAADAGASASPAGSAVSASKRPTVYLAQVGEDRRYDREALRSELVQRGYSVLPDRELPTSEIEYRAEVARLLERSALAVHLLGVSPGTVPEGKGLDSVLVIQNAVAVELAGGFAVDGAGAHAGASPLRRVVSLPAGTVCERPNHQQFLQDMHSRAELQGGAEVITGDLEAVKAAMHVALKAIEAPPPAPLVPATLDGAVAAANAPDAVGAAAGPGTVYVVFVEPDRKATVEIRKALSERFNVLKPVFSTVEGEGREANERWLTECDAVLVFYGSGTVGWKASVDSDLLKARSWRKGRAFRGVFTWVAGPPSDDKDDLVDAGGASVIDARGGYSEALLAPVLAALQGAEHG